MTSFLIIDDHPLFRDALGNAIRGGAEDELVPRHSDYDGLIPSQFRMGRSSGATRIWMLRGTPG